MSIVAAMLLIPTTMLVAIGPFALIAHEQSPDIETLKKSEWVCTASHTRPVLVGRVIVNQTVCTQYNRTK